MEIEMQERKNRNRMPEQFTRIPRPPVAEWSPETRRYLQQAFPQLTSADDSPASDQTGDRAMKLDINARAGEQLTAAEQKECAVAYQAAFIKAALRRKFDPVLLARSMLGSAIHGAMLVLDHESLVEGLREAADVIERRAQENPPDSCGSTTGPLN
jgi:hypothetical protein